jgi:hypothetical protein
MTHTPTPEAPRIEQPTDLRDWFAGLAMQAIIELNSGTDREALAEAAYAIADEMMRRREVRP